ncbi:tetratricopeptide repeat protein [Necator americanus]|uniref:Tetratricopeptide repeat protein n=1 Tax=Necator americanus TaxID=51031 RepID=W2SRG4_NECAM|nr:tetratricopeptide repeat protein [Necator americanus]ETN71451.1 tetratricopeptide repeat protein [Necator americanus]
MDEAIKEWKGKPEEEQLFLMNAQLHVAKGDVDGALAILNTVEPGQPNYHSARVKMAEIYLEEKHDRVMFTMCYRELLQTAPTSATYALLGDAYMSVQEPEKAIESYETALKMSNKDMALTEKIGEAYVLCHLYSKAVNFYESVMNSTKDKRMRLKLADLLHKLGNTEKCIRILRQPLDEEPNPIDPVTISAHVQYLKLLAEVEFEGGKHTEALNDLSTAKNLQMKLVAKNDSPANQKVKKEMAEILCSQAEIYSNAHDHKMVIEKYKEALTYNETDIKTILALANRYLTTNKLAECKQMCEIALSIDRDNDEATLMIADMLYTNNDTDKAIVHFAQLLEKYPRSECAITYLRAGSSPIDKAAPVVRRWLRAYVAVIVVVVAKKFLVCEKFRTTLWIEGGWGEGERIDRSDVYNDDRVFFSPVRSPIAPASAATAAVEHASHRHPSLHAPRTHAPTPTDDRSIESMLRSYVLVVRSSRPSVDCDEVVMVLPLDISSTVPTICRF